MGVGGVSMKGYLLILTSGILFFIIAVITIIHLMSAKALNQQYSLHDMYQDVLNRRSIQAIVSHLIHKNSQTMILPSQLQSDYQLSSMVNGDGSVDFSITHKSTHRISTFNVSKITSQASVSSVDATNASLSIDALSGLQISASQITHLVGLRTVWYPFEPSDRLTHYSFINANGDEERVTVNVSMAEEFAINPPKSANYRQLTLYFSSLSEAGTVSIYLKYSDGSIQNAHIEY
jgi:hypothetical protein